MAALGTLLISFETPMNKIIVGAVFIRKNDGREIHELRFRDNVFYLDMGKKVKEPGQKNQAAVPLVLILVGDDFPLVGD